MRNLIWRGGLAVALALAWISAENAWIRAQEEAPVSPVTKGARQGVLVLKSGQLVEGKLSQNAGGYLVELPKGSYLVPFERVSVAAKDGHEAYEKLKSLEPNPTPDFQVALARWCIAWKLHEEARLELRDALVADPEHKEARQMYVRLNQLMNPQYQLPAKIKPKTKEGFQASDPESLAGLSPELARDYVIRVQPLLLNRCGNAGCHGPSSKQAFQISHIRRGLNKQTLENLDAVLKHVDLNAPDDSPLLKIPSGNHGRNGRPIFYGSAGEQNLQALKEWIAAVAEEQTDDAPAKPKPNAFARRNDSEETPDSTLYQGRPEEQNPKSPDELAEEAKDDLLDTILRSEQKDAFDPAEFNRKFGS